MSQVDLYTSILQTRLKTKSPRAIKPIHGRIIKSGLHLGVVLMNNIINAYAKIEFLSHARNMFDEMPVKNVATYNMILSAYTKRGRTRGMLCIFNELPELDSVFWTVLIVRYSQTSRFEVAHRMFLKIMKRKAVLTECTSTNILASCAAIEAFDVGKKVRSSIVKFGLSGFVYVANYLLNMYKKSGSVEIIVTVFERIKLKDVSTWNAIIAPHAQRGQMEHTLAQFEEMKERDVIS